MFSPFSKGIQIIDTAPQGLDSEKALVRIANGSVLFFVGTFFGLGLNYLYSIVLARVLGPSQFGLYAIGLGAFNLLSAIALGGLGSAVLRFVPASRAQSDRVRIGRILRAVLVLAASFSGFLGVAMFVWSDSFAKIFLHSAEASYVLRFFALAIPLFVVSTVTFAVFQAFQDVRWRTFVKYVCEPVAKFVVTMGLLWAGFGLTSALIALPFALLLSTVLTLFPLRDLLLVPGKSVSSQGVYGEVLRYSTPLLGGLVFSGIATRSDVLLIGYWFSTEQVGIYSAAFQTASIMALVLGTVDSIATPFISESINSKEQGRVQSFAGTVLRWTLIGSFPLFIVMAVFAKDIMALFGKDFESGWAVLIILAFGQFINSVMGSSNSMLLWAGYSKLILWNNIVTSIFQVGLYFVLIPQYGAIGAAIGTTAGLVLTVVMRIVQVKYFLKVFPYDLSICKPFVSGLVALLLALAMKSIFAIDHVALLIGLFVLSYAGCLFALGLHDSDKSMLLNIKQKFNPSS
ncbi:MAG: flippase [Nitrospirales bacterium]|nr:flippase [Nitrospirales bacterium]